MTKPNPKPDWSEQRLATWRNQGIRGMTRGLFFRMWEAQKGLCAICGSILYTGRIRNGFSGYTLDHDHATKKPRGLLCQSCNKSTALKEGVDISQFKNTPFFDYVQRHKEQQNVEGSIGSGEDKADGCQ